MAWTADGTIAVIAVVVVDDERPKYVLLFAYENSNRKGWDHLSWADGIHLESKARRKSISNIFKFFVKNFVFGIEF